MSGGAAAVGVGVGIALIVAISLFPVKAQYNGNIENVVITMERTVCFGACPAYQVTIHGNGLVEYEGHQFVAVTGKQTAQISQEQVRELVNAFYDARFYNLGDRYEANVSDLPSTTTSITTENGTKSVYRYGFGPERLITLEDKIDEIAGTEKWVKQ